MSKKTFQELTFADNFIFCNVLKENPELCRRIVELLLGVPIRRIKFIDSEHTIGYNPDFKSIRMDVYINDAHNTVYDLEMQCGKWTILPKRSRFYISMSDTDLLLKGRKYSELPDTYVIFICTGDPFNMNLPKYEFDAVCLQDHSLTLNDGVHRVFINAKGKRVGLTKDMKGFLDYICGQDPSTDITRDLDVCITYLKNRKDKEREYMFLGDYIREEAEDLAEEIAEEKAKQMAEKIAEKLRAEGLSDERIRAILET